MQSTAQLNKCDIADASIAQGLVSLSKYFEAFISISEPFEDYDFSPQTEDNMQTLGMIEGM